MILALDQGTTSSRAIIFDYYGNIIALEQQEFRQIYPKEGWVEHDPIEIWNTQLSVAKLAIKNSKLEIDDIKAIGITNQRETTVVWDRKTGEPLYNAIVWQDRRTASKCDELKEKGLAVYIQKTCGLVIDAYFSATKINWILENIPEAKEKAKNGDLCFGTIDSWLIWNLTAGKTHATDYSNASRTMIFDIHRLKWDEKILSELEIPVSILPEVKESSTTFGFCDKGLFGKEIPISGVAGDQQAALFGQRCFEAGTAKNTYGTGCFMLMNTGEKPIISNSGLLTTIAWGIDGKVNYALEGSVFIAGAAIQWLRDEVKILDSASDSEYFAKSIPDNGGVYLVPAFSGLGAPYWDMYARGTIFGLTRGSGKAHIIRAALESMAYQTRDLLTSMEKDSSIQLKTLRVDGGATANNFLMQFQSDILNTEVCRPKVLESTALGAAYLAGLAVGFWKKDDLLKENGTDIFFKPSMEDELRIKYYKTWLKAVEMSKSWLKDN
jgi:glycerol kinase